VKAEMGTLLHIAVPGHARRTSSDRLHALDPGEIMEKSDMISGLISWFETSWLSLLKIRRPSFDGWMKAEIRGVTLFPKVQKISPAPLWDTPSKFTSSWRRPLVLSGMRIGFNHRLTNRDKKSYQ
jgi:hypothetical protein